MSSPIVKRDVGKIGKIWFRCEHNKENSVYVCIELFDTDFYEFELKYVVIGSRSSLDCDIMVWVPMSFSSYRPHVYTRLCVQLDVLLSDHLSIRITKEMNSCLGHWGQDENDDKKVILKWCQKGPIGETNNSIYQTFDNHTTIQMFDRCPINFLLSRNIPSKIIGAVRMIAGVFTHASFKTNYRENTSILLRSIFSLPEISLLNTNDLNRFLMTTLKVS